LEGTLDAKSEKMSRGGGRRKISNDLADRKRKFKEDEEANDPVLVELREKARKAEKTLSQKKEENDPLFQYIIDTFRDEMDRDFKRREVQPDLPWGPSFKQQLEDAQVEEEYRELLRDLRILYKHEKPDAELQILAFVRRDRMQTERLAAIVAETDPEGAKYTTSPAADLSDYRTHLNKKKKETEDKTEDNEGQDEEKSEEGEEDEGDPKSDNKADEEKVKADVKCEESESKKI